jgi:hypothetical protein
MTVAALVLAASLPRFVADVGRIDPPFDVPIRAEVEVRNASGAAVELERGIPHCAGCTRVTGVPVTVPAGGTARIGIVFEPGDSRGRLRFGCTLLSGGVPWAVADAEATACGIDLRGPGTVEFGAVESGSASERSFRVRTVGPPGARLQAAAGGSAHAAVAADGAPTALADGTLVRHWLVTARIGCAPGADEVRERIDLRLAAGERTIESRPVVVRAEPWQPSSAAPGALFLGCVDGLDACERHVLLPRGAGALSAEGAEAAAAGPGPGPGPGRERVALRIPLPESPPGEWRLLRGTIALRRGPERWSVPWIGFRAAAAGDGGRPLPSARDVAEVFAFKRDAIRASTTVFRDRMSVGPELLRAADASPVDGELRVDRLVRREHDGSMRVTVVDRAVPGGRSVGGAATDGTREARRTHGGPVEVRVATDHLAHADPAEWEGLAGFVGSEARGTARAPTGDLAAELARLSADAVRVSWDRAAIPGAELVRIDLEGASADSVWLDPDRGLAPVLREAVARGPAGVDRNRWHGDHFFRTPEGIDLPSVVRIFQRRSANPERADGRIHWRTLFDRTLTCVSYVVQEPSPGGPVPVDRVLVRAGEDVARDRRRFVEGGIP